MPAPPSFRGLPIAYALGEFCSSEDVSLHASDLSVLRGYGVFDYLCFRDGRPVFLNDYMDRLFRSASLMDLEVPVEGSDEEAKKKSLAGIIVELIKRNQETEAAKDVQEGGVRIVLTGGYSDDGYTPQSPNLLLLAYPMGKSKLSEARVILHRYERQLPEAKTLDYVEGIRVQKKLKEVGADFALYVDRDGRVRESDRSNYFIVDDSGTLITPGEDVLMGVTRKHILLLAEELGIPTSVPAFVTTEQLESCSEAIICSTTKGPVPIVSIEGRDLAVGPVTKRLMDAYWEYCKRT